MRLLLWMAAVTAVSPIVQGTVSAATQNQKQMLEEKLINVFKNFPKK